MTPTSVLIVDDSRIFRAAIEAALQDHDCHIAGSGFRGEAALQFIRTHPPDVVTLDVEMPGMNGLQTLEAIQQINRLLPPGREVGVIMVSAFTQRGAEVTMQALQAGAFDFVTKPANGSAEQNIEQLRSDLLSKIRSFMAHRRRAAATGGESFPAASTSAPRFGAVGSRPARAVLIAASTGGPKALGQLLPDLVRSVQAPILVVQHMPADFTRPLAEHLSRQVGATVVEARDGLVLVARQVVVARGGMHMVLRRDAQGHLVSGLNEQPPESGCRPSASVLFRSAAAQLGRDAVAIQLTGMGNDGTAGLAAMHRAGAYVIAQDEPSSVVWGMPGSAVAAGVVDAVLPLHQIASHVAAIAGPKDSS